MDLTDERGPPGQGSGKGSRREEHMDKPGVRQGLGVKGRKEAGEAAEQWARPRRVCREVGVGRGNNCRTGKALARGLGLNGTIRPGTFLKHHSD